MNKHIDPAVFLALPSGSRVHPCRLIHKDGQLMWKHALGPAPYQIPATTAIEQHIIKTAQRLEELSSWLQGSGDERPLLPLCWYAPNEPGFEEGIAVLLQTTNAAAGDLYGQLKSHVLSHETLAVAGDWLYFRRC